MRGGHAYAEGAALFSRGAERRNRRRVHSVWLWGALLPLLLLLCLTFAIHSPIALLGLAAVISAYSLLTWRIYRARRHHGNRVCDAMLYAFFCVLGKVPQFLGMMHYYRHRMSDRTPGLIEYKGAEKSGSNPAPANQVIS